MDLRLARAGRAGAGESGCWIFGLRERGCWSFDLCERGERVLGRGDEEGRWARARARAGEGYEFRRRYRARPLRVRSGALTRPRFPC